MESFDKIFILDLHGNSKRKETAPDGSKDDNVFDIQQGVSINLFVKTKKENKKELAKLYHLDLYGNRENKYQYLWENNINKLYENLLNPTYPYYFFVPKSFESQDEYKKGFLLTKVFIEYNSGIQTKRDKICVHFDVEDLTKVLNDFKNLDVEDIKTKYSLPDDGRDWKIQWAIDDIKNNEGNIINILYRPFDIRKTYFTGNSKGFIAYPRTDTTKNIVNKLNYSLISVKQLSTFDFQHIFVTDAIIDGNTISMQTREYNYIFPLYIYSENTGQQDLISSSLNREPNLDKKIVDEITNKLSLQFVTEKENKKGTFAPIDLLDYIYAVLHSPKYRETYKEFLKIDFPRVPYPENADIFWRLVDLGGELRQLHLLESSKVEQFITTYPVSGDNQVTRSIGKNDFRITDHKQNIGQVWINDTQYFDGVPKLAWEFYIGGYQPAQKWLKDRKGRTLDHNDIIHYQKIIVALMETDRIMQAIDATGWMK